MSLMANKKLLEIHVYTSLAVLIKTFPSRNQVKVSVDMTRFRALLVSCEVSLCPSLLRVVFFSAQKHNKHLNASRVDLCD